MFGKEKLLEQITQLEDKNNYLDEKVDSYYNQIKIYEKQVDDLRKQLEEERQENLSSTKDKEMYINLNGKLIKCQVETYTVQAPLSNGYPRIGNDTISLKGYILTER